MCKPARANLPAPASSRAGAPSPSSSGSSRTVCMASAGSKALPRKKKSAVCAARRGLPPLRLPPAATPTPLEARRQSARGDRHGRPKTWAECSPALPIFFVGSFGAARRGSRAERRVTPRRPRGSSRERTRRLHREAACRRAETHPCQRGARGTKSPEMREFFGGRTPRGREKGRRLHYIWAGIAIRRSPERSRIGDDDGLLAGAARRRRGALVADDPSKPRPFRLT